MEHLPTTSTETHTDNTPKGLWVNRPLTLGFILFLLLYNFADISDISPNIFISKFLQGNTIIDERESSQTLRKKAETSLIPPPTTDRKSNIYCTSDNLEQRVCYIRNICRTGYGPWTLYTGEDTSTDTAASSSSCIGKFCKGDGVYVVGLLISNAIYNLDIRAEALPSTTEAIWVEEEDESSITTNNPSHDNDKDNHHPSHDNNKDNHHPILVIQRRHYPKNLAHAIFDDIYPVYWALRQQLIHPAYTGEGAGEDEVGGNSDHIPGPMVYFIIDDEFGDQYYTNHYMMLFHHVQPTTPQKLFTHIIDNHHYNTEVNELTSQTICFHKAYIGFPSITLHRNAGYTFADRRLWKNPIDRFTRDQDRKAFARFLTIRSILSGFIPKDDSIISKQLLHGTFQSSIYHQYTLESSTTAAKLLNKLPTKYITLVRRNTGGRSIRNYDDVKATLETILASLPSSPFILQDVAFEDLDRFQTVALLQNTNMLISIHGAGLSNILYLPPGAVVIELTLPVQIGSSAIFVSLALGLGHHYFACPVLCNSANDQLNDIFSVEIATFKSITDIALQSYVLPNFNHINNRNSNLTTVVVDHMYSY